MYKQPSWVSACFTPSVEMNLHQKKTWLSRVYCAFGDPSKHSSDWDPQGPAICYLGLCAPSRTAALELGPQATVRQLLQSGFKLTQVHGIPMEVSEKDSGHVPFSAGLFQKAEHGLEIKDRVHIWILPPANGSVVGKPHNLSEMFSNGRGEGESLREEMSM